MYWFWRYAALPIGLVLIVLGAGNWSVSAPKVAEYTRRASAPEPIDTRASFDEFERLTARTNSGVLEGLHRGSGDYRDADANAPHHHGTPRTNTSNGLLHDGIPCTHASSCGPTGPMGDACVASTMAWGGA